MRGVHAYEDSEDWKARKWSVVADPCGDCERTNLKPGEDVQFTQTGEHEFELNRVCSQTGAIEKILTVSRVMPSDSVSNREEANER